MKCRYNYLHVVPITRENASEFRGYPVPWFVIIDEENKRLGDGRTKEAADQDFHLRHSVNTPSPEAERLLRRKRRRRRQARQASWLANNA